MRTFWHQRGTPEDKKVYSAEDSIEKILQNTTDDPDCKRFGMPIRQELDELIFRLKQIPEVDDGFILAVIMYVSDQEKSYLAVVDLLSSHADASMMDVLNFIFDEDLRRVYSRPSKNQLLYYRGIAKNLKKYGRDQLTDYEYQYLAAGLASIINYDNAASLHRTLERWAILLLDALDLNGGYAHPWQDEQ